MILSGVSSNFSLLKEAFVTNSDLKVYAELEAIATMMPRGVSYEVLGRDAASLKKIKGSLMAFSKSLGRFTNPEDVELQDKVTAALRAVEQAEKALNEGLFGILNYYDPTIKEFLTTDFDIIEGVDRTLLSEKVCKVYDTVN